jgi:hypothetical protein
MVLDGSISYADVTNARWVPFVIDNTVADELAILPSALDEAQKFDTAGQRYQLLIHTGADHLVWSTEDRFDDAIADVGNPARVTRPGAFTYAFETGKTDVADGIGPTGDYWLDGLAARNPADQSTVTADDRALPDPAVALRRSGPTPVRTPVPGYTQGLTWALGAAPAAQAALSLKLGNVARASIDAAQARLRTGTVTVQSDGATTLGLTGLYRRTRVRLAGRTVARAGRAGTASVALPAGSSTITLTRR